MMPWTRALAYLYCCLPTPLSLLGGVAEGRGGFPRAGRRAQTHPAATRHPSKEGMGRLRSLLPQNGRVVSPWRERGLAVLLAGGLSLVAAGCAVLPIALQRPLPSTGMALRSMETAQERLAEMQDSAASQFEAASVMQPRAVHGAPQAAYRRWVNDEVRELPSPASTVAIMGGTQ